jgi:hypothetical protein
MVLDLLNFGKSILRRQEAEGIPINKFRGFIMNAFFLALTRLEKNLFICFINKFRSHLLMGETPMSKWLELVPFWQRENKFFPPVFCLLPSAFLWSKVDGQL